MSHIRKRGLVFLLLFIVNYFTTLGQTLQSLTIKDYANQQIDCSLYLMLLEDASNTITFEKVRTLYHQKRFIPFLNIPQNQIKAKSSYWAYMHLQNKNKRDTDWILQVGGRNINFADVYISNQQDSIVHKRSGTHLKLSERDIAQDRNKTQVGLFIKSQETLHIYLKIQNVDNKKPIFNVVLSHPSFWQDYLTERNIFQGLFQGGIWILIIFHFSFFLIYRVKTYGIYVCYLISTSAYFLNYFGFIQEFIIPNHPYLFIPIYLFTTSIIPILYIYLINSYVNLSKQLTKIAFIANLWIGIRVLESMAMFLIFIFWNNYQLIHDIHRGFAILEMFVFSIFITLIYLKKPHGNILWLLIGTIILHFGIVLSITATYFGINSFRVNYFYQVSTILEVMSFSIGLGYMALSNEKAKLEAQQGLMNLQKKQAEELEIKVRERTKEFDEQKQEILTQNEELEEQQFLLASHNKNLRKARKYIEKQKNALEEYADKLELKVEERTIEISQINKELVQQNTQLEQFTYIVAHNVRGPVARIKGLVNIIEEIAQTEEERSQYITLLSRTANDIDRIITDLNGILEAKKGLNQMFEEIELRNILDKVLNQLEHQINLFHIKIIVDVEQTEKIYCIPPYMESILYNLISNAIKYRSHERNPIIKINSFLHNERLVIRVKDNGLGIDLVKHGNKLFKLYSRFHQHTEGKGIGLHLIKTQTEAMGGKIKLKSEVERGTTIYIILKT